MPYVLDDVLPLCNTAICQVIPEPPLAPASVETAWRWLCHARRHFPPDADIWHLRFHRDRLLPALLERLRRGAWRLGPMQIVIRSDGETVVLWSAADALVLKLLALALQPLLPVHRTCTHVKGHGGHKAVDKTQMLHLLSRRVRCPIVLDLLAQFLDYSVESGGLYHTPRKGIPRGCPLSPLLAGFHLHELDRDLSRRRGVRYLRFMDDLLILARTRWQLRRAVAAMNAWFAAAGLEQHPDKTTIGRIDKGFDWLGYRFGAKGLCGLAQKTIDNFAAKLRRLYEQTQRAKPPDSGLPRQVVEYINRWVGWAGGGIPERTSTAVNAAGAIVSPGAGP